VERQEQSGIAQLVADGLFMKVEMKCEVEIDVETMARVFCNLDDDAQAQFFVKVAEIAKTFPHFDNQWYYLGGHLRNCECSTDDARDMIDSIHYQMHNSTHS
jgi:hypothetical protein